jgi:hypothetical protein
LPSAEKTTGAQVQADFTARCRTLRIGGGVRRVNSELQARITYLGRDALGLKPVRTAWVQVKSLANVRQGSIRHPLFMGYLLRCSCVASPQVIKRWLRCT